MNESERCPECGSWGEECAFPQAQAGCGCARCLRASRDSAQKQAHDLTKILIREGGVEGAYERRLAEALRERDEAQACLAFERVTVAELRAEVERLRADNADLLAGLDAAAFAVPQGLRTVAERQREACEKYAFCQACANAVGSAALVTEGDK